MSSGRSNNFYLPGKSPLVSVIIPAYNEANDIVECLKSLTKQSYKNIELIVVDDGSSDQTVNNVSSFMKKVKSNITTSIFMQNHFGAGTARNLGALKANGQILVFVDADMTFDSKFVEKLVEPIIRNKTVVANSYSEYLSNINNYWAKCWNIARYASVGIFDMSKIYSMIPMDDGFRRVYRAILKSQFIKIDGFSTDGDYTDDVSLYNKLKIDAYIVNTAVFYHKNPSTLFETIKRASWIGSGVNFTGSLRIMLRSFIKFFPLLSIVKGSYIAVRFRYFPFVFFKIIFDSVIFYIVCANFYKYI